MLHNRFKQQGQPDNANRVRRLGVARVLPRARYSAALRPLLEQPRYAARVADVGRQVRREDGAAIACDALKRLLRASGRLPAGVPLAR